MKVGMARRSEMQTWMSADREVAIELHLPISSACYMPSSDPPQSHFAGFADSQPTNTGYEASIACQPLQI
jgi:hypothetical protein